MCNVSVLPLCNTYVMVLCDHVTWSTWSAVILLYKPSLALHGWAISKSLYAELNKLYHKALTPRIANIYIVLGTHNLETNVQHIASKQQWHPTLWGTDYSSIFTMITVVDTNYIATTIIKI